MADFAKFQPDLFDDWHQSSGYIVALHAEDETSLASLAYKADLKRLNFVEFREPDLSNEVTSIAFAPSYESKRFLSNLKLAGRNHSHAQNNNNNKKEQTDAK